MALIQSAIGRPYTGYYRTVQQKAAALAESLARNHGFVDANKRTAFLIVDLFLHRSGYELQGLKGDRDSELERLILRIVEDRPSPAQIAAWFKERLIRS